HHQSQQDGVKQGVGRSKRAHAGLRADIQPARVASRRHRRALPKATAAAAEPPRHTPEPRYSQLMPMNPVLRPAFRLTLAMLALAAATASLPSAAADATRLLRFPDVCRDQVAFVYAGDLYRASVNGGVAQRLTSHEGRELYPKFSADCRRIAFSAEYNGTRQVYVMPTGGGEPTQLTWYNDVGPMPPRGGTDYRVLDWFPDGQSVLVRANRRGTSE